MEEAEADLGPDYEVGLCQNRWRFFYLLTAFLCIAASLGGIIALFVYSTTRPDGIVCGTNTGFLSFTLVAGLVLTVISPLEVRRSLILASAPSCFASFRTRFVSTFYDRCSCLCRYLAPVVCSLLQSCGPTARGLPGARSTQTPTTTVIQCRHLRHLLLRPSLEL
jgi:hypothetical protein